ncbi:MAG: Dipeptidyl peptidase IV [Cytophagales bacterium]|jgi:dipeptidyl-peptidase-4|nr:DPP IV N-terminal domain-containing protein [Bacteroidota bacterium]WHZ06500.1 MAG: Dipeptidyl peptidase IV [Cytophagales bacterium]
MKRLFFVFLSFIFCTVNGQSLRWSKDGNSYFEIENNEVVNYTLPNRVRSVIISSKDLTPAGASQALSIRDYYFSEDGTLLLVYTNSQRVWRLDTEGDYWVLNLATKKLTQVGKNHPASSLRFAKLSPDGKKIAFVSEYDLYIEDWATAQETAVTTNHSRKLISGTFDWVYEEEFFCRDGFQWSPDSKRIAYWQIDATKIPDYYMINTTDSAYSMIIPVEYPTIGQSPSPAKIGVVDVQTNKTTWLNIPGDPQQHYLPRMEWNSSSEIFVQQLNRKQQESKIFSCNPGTDEATLVYSERDKAWIDVYAFSDNTYSIDFRHPFIWLNNRKEFLWFSDKDGWTHLYRIAKDGSKETLLTPGNYDVIEFQGLDEKSNVIYFLASPNNATQKYLYKTSLDGKGKLELVSPATQVGTHGYAVSPNCKYAQHTFSNYYTKPTKEWVTLPKHSEVDRNQKVSDAIAAADRSKSNVEFFKIKTEDGIEMDGWMAKPAHFDATKKYPVLFFVYTEPASQTATDTYGAGRNMMFNGNMAEEGYIYITLDGRGTPSPKGSAWHKSIYRKIGQLNIRDQAMAAKEILKWPFVDADRIAVWGWSGGGSTTLNLLFQYPDIYKTGIAVAAVANQLTYDNIYQERYMGLPQENLEDIVKGSPVTYAKNLKGNLLYIHGTGDDNVHYNNAEMLLNELIKYNKQFQFMAYPNRTHGIYEGEGTRKHLSTLYSDYLRKYCPPGPR